MFIHHHVFLAFLLALLVAGPTGGCDGCDGADDDDSGVTDDDDTSTDDDDTAAGVITEVIAEVSPVIGTVVNVSWTTSRPTDGVVTWSSDGGGDGSRASDAVGATEHSAQLRGLHASEDYSFQIVASEDGAEVGTYGGEFSTGVLPAEVQQIGLTVTEQAGGDADGGYLYTPLVSGDEVPVIMDRDGNVVWWYQSQEIPIPRILAVKPSCDGKYVWFNSINAVGDELDMAWVVRVSWDGTEVQHFELMEHNHTFVEIPGGDVAVLSHDIREIDDEAIRGDKIVEVAPDGTQTEVWSVWDHFEYEGGVYLPGTGWTHANALEYDPADDAYYVSLRNFDCIVKVDRASGEVVWVLNGDYGDIDILSGPAFAEQHEIELLDGGILIFDNGTVTRYYSRAVELWIDEVAMEAEATWLYAADPPLFVPAGGDVARLPSGNTLVTWSTAGQIDEVTPDGDLVWRVQTDLGAGFFYVEWQDDLYSTDLPGCGP